MGTTQPLLNITDTVTTVKVMDSSATTPALIAAMNYRLAYGEWPPKVPQRNKNPFGLPYLPVLEEMTIDIRGSSSDDALSKLQTLNTLLDQGERWFNNEIVNPVFVRYQPKGSAKSTYLKDVIIGRGFGDETDLIGLPVDFEIVGSNYWIKGIRLKFWRRNGIWLGESETQNVGSSYVAQPGPITVTWSDYATVLSPIDIRIGAGNDAAGESTHVVSGYTMVAHDSRYLGEFAGTAGVAATGTATNDAANFPTHAQIMRYTLATTSNDLWDISATIVKECEYFAVFAKVRNNSTTIDAYIYAGISNQAQQEVKVAAAASPVPQIVFLGIFPTRGRAPKVLAAGASLQINMRAASGSITFDIDSIVVVAINRSTNIMVLNNVYNQKPAVPGVGINILHRLLIEPQGEIALNDPPLDELVGYTGSAYCFTGNSGTVKKTSIIHYYTDGASWNILNTGSTAKITLDVSIIRTKAYLTPE